MARRNKYNNTKVVYNGIKFDSILEANRYKYLLMLKNAGVITDLELQKKFVIIPAQKEPDTIGPRGGVHKGKTLEKEVSYIADFVYKRDGELVVEDTKGMLSREYVIKRKCLLYLHGIRISEIKR